MKRIIVVLALLVFSAGANSTAQGQTDSGFGDGFQSALENNRTNQASTWVNPDTGRTEMVAPVGTFEGAQGQPCREFIQNIFIGGREEQGYGTACRQPDGSWQIVSDEAPPEISAPPARERTTVYIRETPRVYSYPYRYYEPGGYYYPSYYPFSLSFSLGYFHHEGHRHGGHRHSGHRHGGHRR